MSVDLDITVTASTTASPEQVWQVLWDLDGYAEWNPECIEARWIDDAHGPAPGTRFTGRNQLGDLTWTVTCHIIDADPPHLVRWTVADPAAPSSTWTIQIRQSDAHTHVTQSFSHGPGRSGITARIDADPTNAAAILETRAAMLETNMQTGLRRLLALAERNARQ